MHVARQYAHRTTATTNGTIWGCPPKPSKDEWGSNVGGGLLVSLPWHWIHVRHVLRS